MTQEKYIPKQGELIRVSGISIPEELFCIRVFKKFYENGVICYPESYSKSQYLNKNLDIKWRFYTKHQGEIHKDFVKKEQPLKLYL